MPIESAPPFIIITVMIAAMGLIQGGVHKAAYGKPKATGQDAWDRLNAARDARIREEGAQVSDCAWRLGLILTSSVHALTGAETMTGAEYLRAAAPAARLFTARVEAAVVT